MSQPVPDMTHKLDTEQDKDPDRRPKPRPRQTVALGIEYDGGAFRGFQRQVGVPTVQEVLERALSQVADAPVRVAVAGRTDAGVHATGQVVSFRAPAMRPEDAWRRGTNALVRGAAGVVWARVVGPRFHARFSALARRYAYVYLESETAPVLLRGKVTWSRERLDVPAMQAAARHLVGERDFSAFRAAACDSRTPMRRVDAVSVERRGSQIVIDIEANAFLQHMVRNVAGCLAHIGRGRAGPELVADLLAARDRTLAPATAAPDGLYLTRVTYPDLDVANRPPPVA